MLARLILLTACLMAYSPTVRAGQIIFDCDVVFKVTGRATHHVIVVDTEHGIVRYDDMTTGNGVKTPDAENLEEWVQIDGGLAAWGNRHADGSGFTSRFELKLQTGTFTITSTANGQIAHGWCHGPALTS